MKSKAEEDAEWMALAASAHGGSRPQEGSRKKPSEQCDETLQELLSVLDRGVAVLRNMSKHRNRAVELFAMLDTNGDGQLDEFELEGALSELGLMGEDIDTVMLRLDTDGDGFVDVDEFARGYAQITLERQGLA